MAQSFEDELDGDIQSWKNANPDWQTYTTTTASPRDSQRDKQRRDQVYQGLALVNVTYLQRILNAKRLPPNPNRGHWEEFLHSEVITMGQHARGQYLPFHMAMENRLAHIYETVDRHLLGYRGADTIAAIKDHVESWFDTYVRQPGTQAWANLQRQNRRP
jgi:hypothetical protein